MKKAILLSIFVSINTMTSVFAQSTIGAKQIEKMCGCFSVNFKYAETFSPDANYKYHEREDMNAVELALPIEKTDTRVVIQHLLVIFDTIIVKHWREEWLYEAPVMFQFTGDRVWVKQTLPAADVKGKWTQTVWEVSDEPRYQGVSSWIQNDGRIYWESIADAPLPRREYTTRSDYNILKRHNTITVTDEGYTHEQDNKKIQRTAGKDNLVVEEKGYNTYIKMDEGECKVAKEWWKKNEPFWSAVRAQWQTVLNNSDKVNLKWKVDEKMLHEHFDALWKEWRKNNISQTDIDARIKEVMTKFIVQKA